MRTLLLCATLLLLAAGCSQPVPSTVSTSTPPAETESTSTVVYPVQEYISRVTVKKFGQYVRDRFLGYHAGDDVEFTDDASRATEIPVVAIADGEVVRVSRVEGYGGLITIRFMINGRIITALYGHLDLASTDLRPGDLVTRGQFLANLGNHESTETDGERKHLHFALYEGSDGRIDGYESAKSGLNRWLNPSTFLAEN